MTAQELLSAYPDCPTAVAWTELILCEPPGDGDDESSWDLMMKTNPPMTPLEIVGMIQEVLKEETMAKAMEVLKQSHHPSFLRYVAGKMGLL